MFLWVFPLVIICIVGIFVGLWGWTVYLESAKPSGIRRALHVVFLIFNAIEILLYQRETFKGYTLPVIMFCNFWGMFDAILRYPVVHDLDTFFAVKQVCLVALKTMAYAIGFRNLGRNAVTFLCCLFGNVWAVPLLYVMALPIGDSRAQMSRVDVKDVDVMIKVYAFFFSRDDLQMRRDAHMMLTFWKERVVMNLVSVFPGLRSAFVRTGVANKRQFGSGRREI